MKWRRVLAVSMSIALVFYVCRVPAHAAPNHSRRLQEVTECVPDPALKTISTDPSSEVGVLHSSEPGLSVFYVSPNGNDNWSGRLPDPGPQQNDGPFATIERARDVARMTLQEGVKGKVVMGAGDYYLSQPVVFDARDAGLTITAICGETPIVHGGPLVSAWTLEEGIWTAPLNLPPNTALGDLFVDGLLQTEARLPNAPVNGDPRAGWLYAQRCEPGVDAWQGNRRFCFRAADIPAIVDVDGLVAHIVGGFHPGSQWGSDTLPVISIDSENHMVETYGTDYFFTAEGSRYFLSGAQTFLDVPGEWWYDRDAGKISYISFDPRMDDASVVGAILPTFFRLQDADGMAISGLHFRDGAPEGSGKFQTDSRGFGAIRLEGSDHVRLVANVITNVGVGIHVTESKNVFISGNVIGNTAGNGIYIGTTYDSFGKSDDAKVLSNHIHNIGRVYFEAAGIWFQAGDRIRIADNLIENTSQFGIAGGSLWGPQDAVHGAVIEGNTIRKANQFTADGGAIKMMGEQEDPLQSRISNNLISGTGHLMNRADGTFWPPGYENTHEWPTPISWAIYTDGKASGLRIEGNTLTDNVTSIGINGGWSNLVTGNIISGGSGAAFRVDDSTGRGWRPSWAGPNLFERNIVAISNDLGLAAYIYAPDHGTEYVRFAHNRYRGNLNALSFRIHPAAMPSGEYGGLGDLQRAGVDRGSVIDPD